MKIQLSNVRAIELLSAMYNASSTLVRGVPGAPSTSLPSPLRAFEIRGVHISAQCVADLIQRDRGVRVSLNGSELDYGAFEEKFPGRFESAYYAAELSELARKARWASALRCWGTWSPALQGFAALMLFAENWEILFVESLIPEVLYFVSLPGSTYRLGREAVSAARR